MNGNELKAWRREHGYTQETFASELEVTRQTVIGWEKTNEALPRILVLALAALAQSRTVVGRRASAAEQRKMRARSDEPGAKAARED